MPSIIEALKGETKEGPSKPDKQLMEKLNRGRDRMKENATKRQECWEFFRGNQYVYVSGEKYLVKQGTVTNSDGTGKPRHRVRHTRNIILDAVLHEISAATQRVPGYEVSPSTVDADDISAARMSEKIARYGYDCWRVREATVKAVEHAVIADGGFVWPFFDNQIGTAIDEKVATGEVCLRVFGGSEVFWEPGVRFEDSRWHGVEQARPLDYVYQMPGFFGGSLKPDATANEILGEGKAPKESKMVLVTEYLERPSLQRPEGRRLVIANGKTICPEESYPCVDGKGNYVDEPVLHRLSYVVDADNDRDMGLVEHLIDSQRTYNDAGNKALEWKNLALNPQVLAPIGSLKQRLTDEPGAVFEYAPIGGMEPKWRQVPPVPPELFTIQETALRDMGRIAAQNDIPNQVESGKGIVALNERDSQRRQDFISNLADFHSRLMRHCLYLVQRHYSEGRLLKIKGSFGWETIPSFRGADLRGQADVSVYPGSIEPRTRAAIEQKVLAFADRGWIPPQAAMAAINGGYAESLVDDYELDVQRANTVIQKIKMGPEAFLAEPPVPGPDGETVPAWMPRRFDNIPVQKSVWESWMKTQEYDAAPPDVKEAANLVYGGLLQLEAQKAAEEAAQQAAMAEGLGMQNAAKPQGAKPLPDAPSMNGSDVPA